jgi:hypothetical protein
MIEEYKSQVSGNKQLGKIIEFRSVEVGHVGTFHIEKHYGL